MTKTVSLLKSKMGFCAPFYLTDNSTANQRSLKLPFTAGPCPFSLSAQKCCITPFRRKSGVYTNTRNNSTQKRVHHCRFCVGFFETVQ